jgi:hypothetical protein
MLCPEHIRLSQRYDATLRRWGEVTLFSQGVDYHCARGHPAARVRQKAYEERNSAKERVSLHEENCTACISRLSVDRPACGAPATFPSRRTMDGSASMTCLERHRLQQIYDASLRRFGQIETRELLGESSYLKEEVQRRTLNERDAAKKRLLMHQQACGTCRLKVKTK